MSARHTSGYQALHRRFVRAFTDSAHRWWSSTEYFGHWLEATWAFLNAGADRAHFTTTLDRYSPDQGADFARILFELYVPLAEHAEGEDVLGPVYMELTGGRQGVGETYTPWEVAYMMARMQMHDVKSELEAKIAAGEKLTVCDPCVGAGVMLLAAARVIHDECGPAALAHVAFYGQDINPRAILMAKIQLRINGLDGFAHAAATALRAAETAAMVDRFRAVLAHLDSPPASDDGVRLFAPDPDYVVRQAG